jgi:8-oxo-dGTP pyrophosphatase MutT (NUDIX family)
VGASRRRSRAHEAALRRELVEELGLLEPDIGRCVWQRLHVITFLDGEWDGQRERHFLVRVPVFEPRPRLSWEQLNSEYMFEIRWWTLDQLERSGETFAPARLPGLVRDLVVNGPPPAPVDAGV